MMNFKKIQKITVGGLAASGSAIGFLGVIFGAIDLLTYSEMMKAEGVAALLILSAFGLAKIAK